MPTYQSALRHDAESDATDIEPQPKSEGFDWPVIVHTLAGTSHDDGTARFRHLYNVLTHDELAALFARYDLAFALDDHPSSSDVTVYTNESADFSTFRWVNATVHRPDLNGKNRGRLYYDIVFEFTNVEAT
jgi:hypothetical protein